MEKRTLPLQQLLQTLLKNYFYFFISNILSYFALFTDIFEEPFGAAKTKSLSDILAFSFQVIVVSVREVELALVSMRLYAFTKGLSPVVTHTCSSFVPFLNAT